MNERESLFQFRVEGVDGGARSSRVVPFDETYEIAGVHPAEALEKLLHEIEWAILDTYQAFTITFNPVEDRAQ